MNLVDKGLTITDFGLIMDENFRQIEKWGFQNHTIWEWLAYTTEELGELSKAISENEYRQGDPNDIIKEAIQTATLSMKIAVMLKQEMVRK